MSMKIFQFIFRTSIFSFLLLISLTTLAQDNINSVVYFSYDVNGNRVQRLVTVKKIAKNDSTDSIHHDSIINNDNINSKNTGQNISLYPNPTQGLLDLKITNMEEGETAEYVFVSLTGQELLRKKSGLMLTKIDITNFAPGTYIVIIKIGTRQESWKVIKQ